MTQYGQTQANTRKHQPKPGRVIDGSSITFALPAAPSYRRRKPSFFVSAYTARQTAHTVTH